jgi:hypothetical protein
VASAIYNRDIKSGIASVSHERLKTLAQQVGHYEMLASISKVH